MPAHLWLTGCQGEMQNQLLRIPGYDNWVIEKEDGSYIEAFQAQKEKLVYLTADSENILDELDPKAIYIIGGMVDRNRWKGITMKKAKEQGIKTAKLPIGAYLKMSSSQVCFFPLYLGIISHCLCGTSYLTEGLDICRCSLLSLLRFCSRTPFPHLKTMRESLTPNILLSSASCKN